MATEVSRIRILIADDHAMLREGLRRLIQDEPDLEVVAEAADSEETVRLARESRPDLVLLDLGMPRAAALAVLHSLMRDEARPRVLLLTDSVGDGKLAQALELGARGAISKEAGAGLLFKAIRAVVAGEYWLGRDEVSRLLDEVRDQVGRAPDEGAGSPFDRLTPRERQIVAAMAAGESNRAVAERLGMAEPTVKHHLTSVFDKLGVASRTELIAVLHRRA